MEQDEQTLLARVQAYDQDALALIHDTYYPAIFRYVSFRLGDREAAEDITSDVFIRLLNAIQAGNPPRSNLAGWLYGVAANAVADAHRRAYRAPHVALDDALESREDSPLEQAEQSLARADLQQALRTLTPEQQHVLALRYGRNMPIQSVAQTLQKSEGAVKQLQARAIAALTRVLRPAWVE